MPAQTATRGPSILGRFNLRQLPGQGRAPSAIAQIGAVLFVADRASDNVAVIRDRQVQKFIPVPGSPASLVGDPANNRVYVGTYLSRTLSLIENDTIINTLSISDSIGTLEFDGNRLLVGLGSRPAIEIRDPKTLEKRTEIKLSRGSDVLQIVADRVRGLMYVNVYGEIVVLDLANLRELSHFPAPFLFGSLSINPADGTLWAGIFDEKQSKAYVVSFDPAGNERRRVRVGADLRQSIFDATGRLFVASSFTNQIGVVDSSGSHLTDIAVGVQPIALSLDAAGHILYVANEGSDNISVVDTSTLKSVGVIPLGMKVNALISAEDRGRVYAVNSSSDSLFVLEGTQIVREIPVGHHPVDLARDPEGKRLFVANYADGSLAVVDENSLRVTASTIITRGLSTVAVDTVNKRLFAGNTVLELQTLQPQRTLLLKGTSFASRVSADLVRLNTDRQKIYALGYNGIPGSNSRRILYVLSSQNLEDSKVLAYHNGGNITAVALDPETKNLYAGVTHPLAFSNALAVWDAQDQEVSELTMCCRTTGIAINPLTHHLFLAHANSIQPPPAQNTPQDNSVEILDTRTLGRVAWLEVPGEPGPMTVLGYNLYVASGDGMITVISDRATAQPPMPTVTMTATPFPTLTSTPKP